MTTETNQTEQALSPLQNQMAAVNVSESKYEVARRAPERNLSRIWDTISQELKFKPQYAQELWYSIPYKDKQGRTTPVEGVGIRGATMLARVYGHCLSGSFIQSDMGDKVIARGFFVDYKTGFESVKEVIVNKYQVSASGSTYRLTGKHWDNAIQSALSKAQRNATLEGLPVSLKEELFDVAKRLSLSQGVEMSPEKIKEELQKAKVNFIKKYKLPENIYDDYVNGIALESDQELLDHLRGLWGALKTGEETVQAAFGYEAEGAPAIARPKEVVNENNPL